MGKNSIFSVSSLFLSVANRNRQSQAGRVSGVGCRFAPGVDRTSGVGLDYRQMTSGGRAVGLDLRLETLYGRL